MKGLYRVFHLSALPFCIGLIFLSFSGFGQGSKEIIFEIEKLDPRLDDIVGADLAIEVLAEGFQWTEGPLWIPDHQMLLFADIPANSIYKWTRKDGLALYLKPSGYTQKIPRGGEVGANGLVLDPSGHLVLCQHGDRRMARMSAPLEDPQAEYVTLAADYKGKKFNSPNDAVYNSSGDLYFTDPPYGLEKNVDDPLKEISFQGVYKLSADGDVTLLLDSLTRPNGLAFIPGEETLIIANSDPGKVFWYAYDVDEQGLLTNGRVFFDASEASLAARGMPDGIKVDPEGNVFATGPGGIWIFNQDGKALGRIKLNQLVSNISLSNEDNSLFATADNKVLRIQLK